MSDPIAVLRFTVRDPVSVNRAYSVRKKTPAGGKGMFQNPEARAFKERVAIAGLHARAQRPAVGDFWPSNPWRVRRARLSYQLYSYRGDVDGPRKGAKDSLQGILYVDDKYVSDGPADLPIAEGARRIEITVELLEIISETEAHELERTTKARQMKARIARVRLKAKKEQAGRTPGVGAATKRRVPTDLLSKPVPKVRRGIPR